MRFVRTCTRVRVVDIQSDKVWRIELLDVTMVDDDFEPPPRTGPVAVGDILFAVGSVVGEN